MLDSGGEFDFLIAMFVSLDSRLRFLNIASWMRVANEYSIMNGALRIGFR